MRIPVDQLKPGMLVNITQYGGEDGTDIEYYNMRVHAYIPKESGVVLECDDTMGTPPELHNWKSICERHGFPMNHTKRYVVFCSEYRGYHPNVLDKTAISAMLVKMQGE